GECDDFIDCDDPDFEDEFGECDDFIDCDDPDLDDEFGECDDEFFDLFDFDDEEDFFDPGTGSYDDWLTSDDLIDWDGDGDLDEEDFALLEWLYDEDTDDVDGDGFFDEEDFYLSQWIDSEDAEDYNEDGVIDEDDLILFEEFSGIFENEIYYVYIEPGYDRAVVEWETVEPGQIDTIRYRAVGESEWQIATGSVDPDADFDDLFEHFVRLVGLVADTEYEIEILSVSVDGFSIESHEDDFRTRSTADLRPAVILYLDYEVDLQWAWIFWETNRLTDARYTLTRVSDGQIVAQDTLDQAGDFVHDVELEALEPGTEYDLAIESVPVGLEGLAAEADVRDEKAIRFSTRSGTLPVRLLYPPVEIVGPSSALISVEFNQSVRLRVDYARVDNFRSNISGTTTARLYKDSVITSTASSHLINVAKLKASTAYRYRIVAFAANGDSLTTDPRGFSQWNYDWQFFTTDTSDSLAPIITEGPQIITRDQIAALEWSTDVETTGRVFFGTQGGTYGTADEFSVADLAVDGTPYFTDEHFVTLSGLEAGTTYQFRIESTGANGRKVVLTPSVGSGKAASPLQPPGGAGSFTTSNVPDTQRPVILAGPTVTSRTHESAIVEWVTDEPANGRVSFGVDTLKENVRDGASSVAHRLVLSNLQAGTSYRYQVASSDVSDNGPVESLEGAFTTNSAADLTNPRLTSSPAIIYKNDNTATLRWTTDEVTTGRVLFGRTDSLSMHRDLSRTGTEHVVTLTNLVPSSRYYYRIEAKDVSNNGPTQSVMDSFTTDAEPDLTSPVLSDLQAAPADSLAIVRWETDEAADSFVEFGLDSLLLGARIGDGSSVLRHEITVTNLTPNTRYYYKVGSVDPVRNPVTESAVGSFTTLAGPDVTAPGAPAGLTTTPGSQQVVLSWRAGTDADLAGYNIYRGDSTGIFRTLVTRVTDTTYVDGGLSDGQLYRYRVTAVDRAANPNESSSDTVSVRPTASAAPTAPAPVTATGSLRTPTLEFSNATPFQTGQSLTYAIQVSPDSVFATFAASVSGLSEGAGNAQTGRTAWTVDRELAQNTTYYWRARAEEGGLLGPFSITGRFVTKRAAEPLTGDFNDDRTVNFDDFFLFIEAFGKQASVAGARYDLDNNSTVDFGDFFLFVDQFGKSASSKMMSPVYAEDQVAQFALSAQGDEGGHQASVTLAAQSIEGLRAFGVELRWDAHRARFLDLAPGDLLESGGQAPFLRVLSEEPGRIVFGNGLLEGVTVSGTGLLSRLSFQILGEPADVSFSSTALIARSDGRTYRVAPFPTAQLVPQAYRLGANYPNPFNPSTSIEYALPADGPVRLVLFDVLGQQIRVLVDERSQRAGYHTMHWNGRDQDGRSVASGIYFYVLKADVFRQVRKMVLIK
ncbi:MAG: T9SS type A sorting domain-containing protein, partial [Gemmatimonadetes bacterium]|nr:T9SS type A sorting domain-containing protein [Gemmatimonadota bacterium]